MDKLRRLPKRLIGWARIFWILLRWMLSRIGGGLVRWLCFWCRGFWWRGIGIVWLLDSRLWCCPMNSISMFCKVLKIIRLLRIVIRILRDRGVCKIWIRYKKHRDRFSSLWWRGSNCWKICRRCKIITRGRNSKGVMVKVVRFFSWLGKRLQSKQKSKIELIS